MVLQEVESLRAENQLLKLERAELQQLLELLQGREAEMGQRLEDLKRDRDILAQVFPFSSEIPIFCAV